MFAVCFQLIAQQQDFQTQAENGLIAVVETKRSSSFICKICGSLCKRCKKSVTNYKQATEHLMETIQNGIKTTQDEAGSINEPNFDLDQLEDFPIQSDALNQHCPNTTNYSSCLQSIFSDSIPELNSLINYPAEGSNLSPNEYTQAQQELVALRSLVQNTIGENNQETNSPKDDSNLNNSSSSDISPNGSAEKSIASSGNTINPDIENENSDSSRELSSDLDSNEIDQNNITPDNFIDPAISKTLADEASLSDNVDVSLFDDFFSKKSKRAKNKIYINSKLKIIDIDSGLEYSIFSRVTRRYQGIIEDFDTKRDIELSQAEQIRFLKFKNIAKNFKTPLKTEKK